MKKVIKVVISHLYIKNPYYIIFSARSSHSPKRIYLSKILINILLYAGVGGLCLLTVKAIHHFQEFSYLRGKVTYTLIENMELQERNAELLKDKENILAQISDLEKRIEREKRINKRALSKASRRLKLLKKSIQSLKAQTEKNLSEKKRNTKLGADEGGPTLPLNIEKRRIPQKLYLSGTEAPIEKKTTLNKIPKGYPVIGRITSGFGRRGRGFHPGIDIAGPVGTPIRATADGIVVFASRKGGYGKLIEIDHGNGYSTRYGHLMGFAVKKGERVRKGQVIGWIGLTGRTTGPHLHYEVRRNNIPVNPRRYLK